MLTIAYAYTMSYTYTYIFHIAVAVWLLAGSRRVTSCRFNSTVVPGDVKHCSLATSSSAAVTEVEIVSGMGEQLARFAPIPANH